MAEIAWLVLSAVLLIFAGVLMFMTRPIFFPTGERVLYGGLGLSLGLGIFFTLTKWAEVREPLAGSMVILALLVGWFWPQFKDPGMAPKAPHK